MCVREEMDFVPTYIFVQYDCPLLPPLPPRMVWALFLLFTFLHLFANWRAVRAVVMNRVNRNRFHLMVDLYLRAEGVRSPEHISSMETLLPSEHVERERDSQDAWGLQDIFINLYT